MWANRVELELELELELGFGSGFGFRLGILGRYKNRHMTMIDDHTLSRTKT